jgi:hypothetical protein
VGSRLSSRAALIAMVAGRGSSSQTGCSKIASLKVAGFQA